MDLDLPEPSLNLDLPEPGMGGLADIPLPDKAQNAARKAAKPAGKPSQGKPAGKKKGTAGPKAGKRSRKSSVVTLPLMMNILSILLLLIILVIMYLYDLPVNQVPGMTLTTYVQALWLFVGCFLILILLQDVKTALLFTGIDIAMFATIFPTLWLLTSTPMNPMYFFVMGMIVVLALIGIPMSTARHRKAAEKKIAPAPAGAPVSAGPKIMP